MSRSLLSAHSPSSIPPSLPRPPSPTSLPNPITLPALPFHLLLVCHPPHLDILSSIPRRMQTTQPIPRPPGPAIPIARGRREGTLLSKLARGMRSSWPAERGETRGGRLFRGLSAIASLRKSGTGVRLRLSSARPFRRLRNCLGYLVEMQQYLLRCALCEFGECG